VTISLQAETDLFFIRQEAEDDTPNSTQEPLKCVEQSDSYLHLIQEMAKRPQEYTPVGSVTTKRVHGLVLKYHGKKVGLHPSHYVCKTSQTVYHKVTSVIVESSMPVEDESHCTFAWSCYPE